MDWREELRAASLHGCAQCPYAGRITGTGINASCYCGNPPQEVSETRIPGLIWITQALRCPENQGVAVAA